MKKIQLMTGTAFLSALLLVGCSSDGQSIASATELETAVGSAVRSSTGQDSTVDCGEATLKLEVSETAACQVTLHGESEPRSALATVSSVSDEGYSLDVQLNPAFEEGFIPLTGAELAHQTRALLSEQNKVLPLVECTEPLPREVGAQTRCKAYFTGENSPRSVQLSVQTVDENGVVNLAAELTPSVADAPLSDSLDSVETLVEESVRDQLGDGITAECGEGSLLLEEGNSISCELSSVEEGSLGTAEITIQRVDGGSYSIAISMEQRG